MFSQNEFAHQITNKHTLGENSVSAVSTALINKSFNEAPKTDSVIKTEIRLADKYFNKKNWVSAKEHYLVAYPLLAASTDTILLRHVVRHIFMAGLKLSGDTLTQNFFELDTTLAPKMWYKDNTLIQNKQHQKFEPDTETTSLDAIQMRENRFLLIFGSMGSMLLILLLGFVLQMRTRNYNQLMLRSADIQSQNKKLEESNAILTQFAYVAAHDLKEPLRSIGSYIGILQIKYLKNLPPEAGDYMQFINSGVKRMYLLLNDLLELSQVISQQPGAEVVRPEDVLNDVRANLHSAIEAKHARIEYATNMPGVRMNRNHLMQLFQNLIGNALKFTTEQPFVQVTAIEEPKRIVFTVADNGIGIKKDYSQKIFVLFQQLNKKGSYEGTGIGLTICKNIVEKYNGIIWFESEENVGTKFHFAIPSNAA